MSLRTGQTGVLSLARPGNASYSVSCWAKVVLRTNQFACLLGTQDSNYFNFRGFFLDSGNNDLLFSSPTNSSALIANTLNNWFYIAYSWNAATTTYSVFGIDHNNIRTHIVATGGSDCNSPPFMFLSGQSINGGGGLNDEATVLYRGVHFWTEVKSDQFLVEQSKQLAPLSTTNLYSTLWGNDKAIGGPGIGYSSV